MFVGNTPGRLSLFLERLSRSCLSDGSSHYQTMVLGSVAILTLFGWTQGHVVLGKKTWQVLCHFSSLLCYLYKYICISISENLCLELLEHQSKNEVHIKSHTSTYLTLGYNTKYCLTISVHKHSKICAIEKA